METCIFHDICNEEIAKSTVQNENSMENENNATLM